ncbi:hypothetical protein N9055_00790 [Akkermansiaceae bacterium]|nr:hypothetical protein [bacterium]MDB4310408.1 hypothetical protein [Akkermansiaceae bacterium]MDB4364123.1 hypothetical protein [Akkermansiaceae bacterium]MDB4506733.1 hypothetical protein [Akkermansiaceae bacterium]MDC1206686.1 hypothetical protein [Akkermansiaceae bacterium]
MPRCALISFFPLLISSCSLVTTPVKIVGKVATTTIGLTGKAAGAGIDAITPGGDSEIAED